MSNAESIDNARHSLAHLLAAAVLEHDPKARLGIGPVIEHGFYYDFKFSKPLTPEELPKLEARMRELIKQKLPFSGREVTAAQAKKLFAKQPFKLDLIREFAKEKQKLTVYKTGDIFEDLCRGGHVANTSEIPADGFKLTHLAGAYWRGSEKNPQLTRIYGLSFASKKELDAHLAMLEEAKKRDHKKLGAQLGLFMFHETAPGMPYWLPKGVMLYNELVAFWREEHQKRGYQETFSPLINKKELYVTSGHYDHYWQEMFVTKTPDGEEYGLKAMNCPNAMVIFGSRGRSYRELPFRLSDTDPLHRYELSGVLNGLLRVRAFRQDDAHIFVTEEQVGPEYEEVFKIVERFYSVFDLPYSFRLGTRPEKFMGDVVTWNRAEKILKQILEASGKTFTVAEGDGAFYGPKVDIIMKDALGREWQMGTIQLDFQQPKRFKLEYIDEKGQRKTPIAIHRVIYGSLERFIGILIEHTAGKFPLWLAPVQVKILPVSEKFIEYEKNVKKQLKEMNIRVELDDASETLGKRIREAELQKIPYVLVVGEKEMKNGSVNVRHYTKGATGEVGLNDFLKKLVVEIERKSFAGTS